ncbi:MAG: hypothetical protein WD602_09085 [Actinomycetota bacterium]
MPAATPALAPGLELLGRFDGSGTKGARYLIKRQDGKMLLVSALLYVLVDAMRNSPDPDRLAGEVGRRMGRSIGPDGIEYLIEHKLRPIGILNVRQDRRTTAPLLSLAVSRAILPESFVASTARFLSIVFHPAVAAITLLSTGVLFAWLWAGGALDPQAYDLQRPGLVIAILALTVISAVFHELGHAAAAVYGGATPGRIGVGIYIVWPAFYTDLTDSYRLSKAGRVRTDLGGVYFNLIFTLLLAGANSVTGHPVFLAAVVIQYFLVAVQFIPFLRLDGYYLLSDLSGVPDLFKVMRAGRGDIRHGKQSGAMCALRPGIQLFATYWMVLNMMLTAGFLVWFAWRLPALPLAIGGLFTTYATAAGTAFGNDAPLAGTVAGLGLILVGLQIAGLGVLATRGAARVASLLTSR